MGKFSSKTKDEVQAEKAVEKINEGTAAAENTSATTEAKATKSIVPAKYAGKYKDASQDDALRRFVKEQAYENGKVNLDKFYALCGANGVAQDQIDKYKALTDQKIGGASGRAVMTLRNLMVGKARKGDGMVGLDGQTYDVKLPPVKATGAVAAAAEARAAAAEQPTENAG